MMKGSAWVCSVPTVWFTRSIGTATHLFAKSQDMYLVTSCMNLLRRNPPFLNLLPPRILHCGFTPTTLFIEFSHSLYDEPRKDLEDRFDVQANGLEVSARV